MDGAPFAGFEDGTKCLGPSSNRRGKRLLDRESIMNSNWIRRGLGLVCSSFIALSLAGCSVEAMDDEMDDSEDLAEDIGEASDAVGIECANAPATMSFTGGINYSSPQTYSTTNCYKGVVLDVTSYSQVYTQPAIGGGRDGRTEVQWADALPLRSEVNAASRCGSLWMLADLFESVGDAWVHRATKETNGSWMEVHNEDWDIAQCMAPLLSFSSEMQAGKKYRISTTARTAQTSAAPTRKLTVKSIGPDKIY
jgi:hypothetical protein